MKSSAVTGAAGRRTQHQTYINEQIVRCSGLVVSVPATRSARPGFESWPILAVS